MLLSNGFLMVMFMNQNSYSVEFLTMVKFGDTYKYATSQENPSYTRALIMNSNNSNMIKPDKTLKFDGAGIGYMDRQTDRIF